MFWKGKNMAKIRVACLMMLMLMSFNTVIYASVNEVPVNVYSGTDTAISNLSNVDYLDLKNVSAWSKDAIYQTAVLGFMKGYGARTFGRKDYVSKEQAIAVILRIAGMEQQAQTKGSEIRKKSSDKNPLGMWSDGYIDVAKSTGLITKEEYADAFADQTKLGTESFYRARPAQRQELAFWIATALGIQPTYDQSGVFNNYKDWQKADGEKVPYIESIIRKKIMNGTGNGNFYPDGFVTREQLAQIVMNLQNEIVLQTGIKPSEGTIEDIKTSYDNSLGLSQTIKIFYVRNMNGDLDLINTKKFDISDGKTNELTSLQLKTVKDFVVLRNGNLGKSELLSKGQKINYYTDKDKNVKFIKVSSDKTSTKYILAQIENVDISTKNIGITQLSTLASPDSKINLKDDINLLAESEPKKNYTYSNDVALLIYDKILDISELQPYEIVVMTVKNDIVTQIDSVDPDDPNKENGVYSGIVEENNTDLKYIKIRIYDKDAGNFETKIFEYTDSDDLSVVRNYKNALLVDVEEGDTIFVKVNSDNYPESISTVSNYTLELGKIQKKQENSIAIDFGDNGIQIFDVAGIVIMENGKIINYNDVNEGDEVKLLMNRSSNQPTIKEMNIERRENLVTRIYKGNVSHIDKNSGSMQVYNLKNFYNGSWKKVDTNGINNLKVSDQNNIYVNNKKIPEDTINKSYSGSEAYIAVKMNYGEEEVFLVTYKNSDESEVLYNDIVLNTDGKKINLYNSENDVLMDASTFVIKNGHLVTPSSVGSEDEVNVIGGFGNEKYTANFIQVKNKNKNDNLEIYRGRVISIDENQKFTIESYSKLNGDKWDFTNLEKTFEIENGTRFVNENGVSSIKNFVPYGSDNYVGKTVYVIARGNSTIMVDYAAYVSEEFKGEIYGITKADPNAVTTTGTTANQDNTINIWKAKKYNADNYVWEDSTEKVITVPKNSLIIKNGNVIGFDNIEKGDKIKTFIKEASGTAGATGTVGATTMDGIIIILE